LKASNPSEADTNLKQEIMLSNSLIRAYLKLLIDDLPSANKLYVESKNLSEKLIINYTQHSERLRKGTSTSKDGLDEFQYYEKVQELKFVD